MLISYFQIRGFTHCFISTTNRIYGIEVDENLVVFFAITFDCMVISAKEKAIA